MNAHQELAIRALSTLRSDDAARARHAFKHCTPEEMSQQYGASGKTRAEILKEYEQSGAQIDDAIAWVKSQAEGCAPAVSPQPNYPTLKYPFNPDPMPSLLNLDDSDEMRKNYTITMWGERIAHVMKECPIGATVEGGKVGGYLIEPLNPELAIKVVDRRQGQLRVLMAYADS